ncbi:MAG: hypothetical protein WD646_11760 [Actinomycetota bacterium]
MRLRALAVMSLGMLALAGPALGQSGNASNSSSAGGSSASTGSSSSSASISTGGGGSVGVVQGAVSGGSTAGGSQSSGSGSGSSSSGGGGGSSSAATAADEGANAAQDGIVSQLDLPAMGTVEDSIPASGMSSSVLILGLAAVFAVGLFVLYRKLPRAGATA